MVLLAHAFFTLKIHFFLIFMQIQAFTNTYKRNMTYSGILALIKIKYYGSVFLWSIYG